MSHFLYIAPPQHPPPHIIPVLTLNNSVPLEYYYVDDSNGGKGQLAGNCKM